MFNHSSYKPATAKQLKCLQELGFKAEAGISMFRANQLIKANQDRWNRLPPTEAQRWRLQKTGKWRPCLTRGEAMEIIEAEVQAERLQEEDERPRPCCPLGFFSCGNCGRG